MPTFANTMTMPVSWQIGRRPSAHMRELREDLRDGVARRGRLLELVGPAERADVIRRMVVRDVLQGVGDAVDEILLV